MSLLSDPTAIMNQRFTLTTGVGFDAGLRWNWKERVAFGLSCRDAYSPALVTNYSSVLGFINDPTTAKEAATEYARIAPKLSAGLMWSPNLGRLGSVFDSFVLAADYNDFLDLLNPLPRNAILNVGLGAEAKLLGILAIRVGIDKALLNAGAGLDLGIFRLNLTAFGDELGSEPGSRPVYNLMLSFEFIY
jgi:hypothetical protein